MAGRSRSPRREAAQGCQRGPIRSWADLEVVAADLLELTQEWASGVRAIDSRSTREARRQLERIKEFLEEHPPAAAASRA